MEFIPAKPKADCLSPVMEKHSEADLIKKCADKALKRPFQHLRLYTTGLFDEMTAPIIGTEEYFERRKSLNCLAIMCLTTDNDAYMTALESYIRDICVEGSWNFPCPVHYESEMESNKETVDLFAVETASLLSEILENSCLKLDAKLVEYTREEIRKRVITPFALNGLSRLGWSIARGNWTAVSSCFLASTLFYEGSLNEINKRFDLLSKSICTLPDKGDDMEYDRFALKRVSYAYAYIRKKYGDKLEIAEACRELFEKFTDTDENGAITSKQRLIQNFKMYELKKNI